MKKLGETARKGPRTGVIEIDWGKMATAAAEVVDTFKPCGSDDYVQPVGGKGAVTTTVRDAASGKERPVEILTIPVVRGADYPNAEAIRRKSGDGRFSHEVVLYPRISCMAADEWRSELRSTLAHELTHSSEAERKKLVGRKQNCPYFNSPHEVAAFLSQVREELNSFHLVHQTSTQVRTGDITDPAGMLAQSRKYRSLLETKCLTPRNRRRFLQMAARLWDERGYERPGSKWAARYFWKDT